MPREVQREECTRDIEIDPKMYDPEGEYREPLKKLPEDLKFTKDELQAMLDTQHLCDKKKIDSSQLIDVKRAGQLGQPFSCLYVNGSNTLRSSRQVSSPGVESIYRAR